MLFIQGKCTQDNIMLACRRVGATVLTALAWADKATPFGVTDDAECKNSCSGNVVQVSQCTLFCLNATLRILLKTRLSKALLYMFAGYKMVPNGDRINTRSLGLC